MSCLRTLCDESQVRRSGRALLPAGRANSQAQPQRPPADLLVRRLYSVEINPIRAIASLSDAAVERRSQGLSRRDFYGQVQRGPNIPTISLR